MKLLLRMIFSTIISSIVFGLFYVIFEAGAFLSFLFGLAGFIGGALLLSPKKRNKKIEELKKIYGITPAKLKEILKDGKKKIRKMRKISKNTEDIKIKDKIYRISNITEKIFKDFEYDPKDIKAARQFLNYYLDATIKIIEQYSILYQNKSDPDKRATLKNAEKLMERIEIAFENQLKKLYDDDFIDLDTEIKVLEKAVKYDGL